MTFAVLTVLELKSLERTLFYYLLLWSGALIKWIVPCHTPGPSSQCPRRGGQIGGEITLEVTTWICLPINLVTFVSPSLPSLYNLCLPDATFGLGNPAVFCVLFYAMTKPEDESLCEFTSVLPKPSLQGQKGQDRRGRMCVVTYRNHIGFNVT